MFCPTGFTRTYPNLLTQEGVQGNEHMPTATHNATLPFTRSPADPSDYTICICDASTLLTSVTETTGRRLSARSSGARTARAGVQCRTSRRST